MDEGSGLQEKEGSSLQKSLRLISILASVSLSGSQSQKSWMCLGWGTERHKILAQSGSKKLFAQSSQCKNHRLTKLFIVGASEAFFLNPLYYR